MKKSKVTVLVTFKILQVLEDLIGLTLSLAQNHHCLSGCTSFSRIDLPVYPDPLNGN